MLSNALEEQTKSTLKKTFICHCRQEHTLPSFYINNN